MVRSIVVQHEPFNQGLLSTYSQSLLPGQLWPRAEVSEGFQLWMFSNYKQFLVKLSYLTNSWSGPGSNVNEGVLLIFQALRLIIRYFSVLNRTFLVVVGGGTFTSAGIQSVYFPALADGDTQGTLSELNIDRFQECFYRLIGLVGRVFANGPGDLGSIPGRVIPKILKMVLDTSLLNTQQYKVHIRGKVEQFKERSIALPYTSV